MPPFIAQLIEMFMSIFADKLVEQLEKEDTIEDAETTLTEVIIDDLFVHDLDLLNRFDGMLGAHAGTLRAGDQIT